MPVRYSGITCMDQTFINLMFTSRYVTVECAIPVNILVKSGAHRSLLLKKKEIWFEVSMIPFANGTVLSSCANLGPVSRKSRNFSGHFRVPQFLLYLKNGEDLSRQTSQT